MSEKIPCTAGLLTFNSGDTLAKALASIKDCAELIICDGGSTDDTVAIAESFGAKVVRQDSSYKDATGRIIDFGAARNQLLAAASYPWFMFLDSDEYVDEQLMQSVRETVAKDVSGAFWFNRKYVIDGKVIDQAMTYPNRQLRLFHCSVTTGFVKTIHERLAEQPKYPSTHPLPGTMYVPLGTPRDLASRWVRYERMEHALRVNQTRAAHFHSLLMQCRLLVSYGFRFLRSRLGPGEKIPLAYEALRYWFLLRPLGSILLNIVKPTRQ